MPTYDHECNGCGSFEAIRSIARRDEPVDCPHCGEAAPRVLLVAPQLACMDGATRSAHATNERAQHVPRSSRDGSYGRLKHPSGCGCCSSAKRSTTLKAADGSKAFPSKRPWMISH
jgi:putative FmdB family regulatory protein